MIFYHLGCEKKGQVIYNAGKNDYLGTTDLTESKLDFTGKLIHIQSTHTKDGTTIKTTDNFSYDHVGRLLSQKQIINSGAEEIILENSYDDLGQCSLYDHFKTNSPL